MYDRQPLQQQLTELAEPAYQKFASSLLPGISGVIGVRLPLLRKLAKQLARGEWRPFIEAADVALFEESMLQGMVIGYAKLTLEERLQYMSLFVPRINNWSVCDSFCGGLTFAKQQQAPVWSFLQPYLQSTEEYEVRFGVVMLLNFFINEDYIERVLLAMEQVKHSGYYAKMAVAWALSICFVKQPEYTLRYLQHNTLDDFTYNKTLQKIIESQRILPETKAMIRQMRRSTKQGK